MSFAAMQPLGLMATPPLFSPRSLLRHVMAEQAFGVSLSSASLAGSPSLDWVESRAGAA